MVEQVVRMPSPPERDVLRMSRGVPVMMFTRRFQIRVDGHDLPAGLLMLVRGDRARMLLKLDEPG